MTNYTQWKSLVDLHEYSAIPDSELYYRIDEESGDVFSDSQGDNDATSTGSLIWVADSSVGHDWYVELDDTNYLTLNEPFVDWETDWTVGIEIVVDSEISTDTAFWSWSDGDRIFSIGTDDSGDFGTATWNGSSQVDQPGHSQPEAPYNVDLVMTWNSSEKDAELFLDESPSTLTEQQAAADDTEGETIGSRTDGTRDIEGRGVARFSIWDRIVDPSEFTL